ncbi:MAG TPA: MFS transporter [Acidimicrobiales bacterium]|nr:MFS transporter [Acidimicrobiales bacterium]
MPKVLMDITPLRRSRDYRRLYFGQGVSFMGSQLTVVAVPFQVYQQTRSSFMVGLVSLGQLGPLIIGSLIGGSIADSVDRRRLLLVAQVAMAATTLGLALNSMTARPALWPVFVFSAAGAAVSGLDRPARGAAIPGLVGLDQVAAANALWQLMMQVGTIAGPAIAGVLLAGTGLSAVYWIDVATYAVSFLALLVMAPMPVAGGGTRAGLSSIMEGLRFVRSRRVLQANFLIDIDAMVFGLPRALFPALAVGLYGGGAATLGLLFAAPGVGALLGALTTGWVAGVRHQGRAVLIAVAVWGLAMAGFGVATWLPIGLVLLAVAGAADVVSAVFRNTILQHAVPDALRGRLSSVHIAVVTGGPRLGDAESGAVAALASPQVSVVSGGLACLVGVAVIAWRYPEFRNAGVDDLPAEAVTGAT